MRLKAWINNKLKSIVTPQPKLPYATKSYATYRAGGPYPLKSRMQSVAEDNDLDGVSH